jgi:ABC-2 type transport system permease protein
MTVAPSPSAVPRHKLGASRWQSYWTLYKLALRQHLHGKRWMVMTALFLLPVGLAVLVRNTSPNVPLVGLEFMLVMMFVPQALLPLLALLYGSGVVQDEQEEQTITYLLVRPIPKWVMYTIKLLAAMTTTSLLVSLFLAITFAAVYVGTDASWADVAKRWLPVAAVQLAVVTYCSVFGLFSLLTKRILVAGVLYTAIVEVLFANLPFGIRLATVLYYMRIIIYHSMSYQYVRSDGKERDIADRVWQFDVRNDPDLLLHPSLGQSIATLVIASLVCTAIAGWLCSQREFHVKTPEKD